MSEHPLSSITKSHITNCLRTVTNKSSGRFLVDGLSAKITLHINNEDGVRDGTLRLIADEVTTNIMHSVVYFFRERHIDESILQEGEFKLKPEAIELIAYKWISDIQRAIRESKE